MHTAVALRVLQFIFQLFMRCASGNRYYYSRTTPSPCRRCCALRLRHWLRRTRHRCSSTLCRDETRVCSGGAAIRKWSRLASLRTKLGDAAYALFCGARQSTSVGLLSDILLLLVEECPCSVRFVPHLFRGCERSLEFRTRFFKDRCSSLCPDFLNLLCNGREGGEGVSCGAYFSACPRWDRGSDLNANGRTVLFISRNCGRRANAKCLGARIVSGGGHHSR